MDGDQAAEEARRVCISRRSMRVNGDRDFYDLQEKIT
jgi:hypothetical protein